MKEKVNCKKNLKNLNQEQERKPISLLIEPYSPSFCQSNCLNCYYKNKKLVQDEISFDSFELLIYSFSWHLHNQKMLKEIIIGFPSIFTLRSSQKNIEKYFNNIFSLIDYLNYNEIDVSITIPPDTIFYLKDQKIEYENILELNRVIVSVSNFQHFQILHGLVNTKRFYEYFNQFRFNSLDLTVKSDFENNLLNYTVDSGKLSLVTGQFSKMMLNITKGMGIEEIPSEKVLELVNINDKHISTYLDSCYSGKCHIGSSIYLTPLGVYNCPYSDDVIKKYPGYFYDVKEFLSKLNKVEKWISDVLLNLNKPLEKRILSLCKIRRR